MVLLHLPDAVGTAQGAWDFLLAWQPEPVMTLVLLVIGGLYWTGLRRLRGIRHQGEPGVPRGRWFFVAGLLVASLALISPIHSYSQELFFLHMTQHVLLMSVAAPLLLLGNPLPVTLWAFKPAVRLWLARRLVAEAALVRVLRFLTRPIVAWWIFVLNLWLWHQPAAYQAALESELLHYAQHALFFWTAVLFWWPVIGPAPLRSRLAYPARMLYVFATWIPNSILGAGITFAPSVLIPYYSMRPRHWGIDVLTDQQLAGLIMWLPGDAIYAATMIILLLATLRQEDRREARSAAAT